MSTRRQLLYRTSAAGPARSAKLRRTLATIIVGSMAAAALVAGAAMPSNAVARGDLTYSGCIANSGAAGCGAPTHNSLANARNTVVSPDGANVYATAFSGDSVTTFDRNLSTGALTYAGCIANAGANGCVAPTHDSLANFDFGGITVSPDGANVYAAALLGNSITTFNRDAVTGALTYAGCIADAGANGCNSPTHDSMEGAEDVVVSADGANVYVSAFSSNSVTSFTRDPGTGVLTYAGCIANGGDSGCDAPAHDSLTNLYGLAIQGANVYAAGGDSVSTLTRAPGSGVLTYTGCIANDGDNGCDTAIHDSLDGAYGIEVSPDGASAYATATNSNSVTSFTRNSATGALTYSGCIANTGSTGCDIATHDSLAGAQGIGISPDGASVYTTASGADSVTTFAREASTSALTYIDCIADAGANGCEPAAHESLDSAYGLAISADGASVYAASANSNSVTTFTRYNTPPPVVGSISPPSGASAGGTAVTITGSGFDPATSVSIGGVVCVIVGVTTATSLTCTTGAHADGAADVTVINPDSQSDTKIGAYTYVTAPATKQFPVNHCVTPGVNVRAIPRDGVKRLMKPGCRTNAGQRIGVAAVHAKTSRADVRLYRLICVVHGKVRKVRKLAGQYEYCARGTLAIQTYGIPMKLAIRWHAARTGQFSAYNLTRTYRT